MIDPLSPLPSSDRWAGSEAYERFMGRWSAPIATRFLDWLDAAPGRRWLDAGCGTGTLTRAIMAGQRPSALLACDFSPTFVAYARRHHPGVPAAFFTADVRALPLPPLAVDLAVSGIMLNFVPRPQTAVSELIRVTRPGGRIATYLWDYAGEMQMLRLFWDTAVALDPSAAPFDEGRRFPLGQRDALAALLRECGLREITTAALEITCHFASFADYWQPFLGGTGPAPTYVAALSPARRLVLREALRRRLPTAPTGAIILHARAWAAAGRIPR